MKRLLFFITSIFIAFTVSAKVTLNIVNETGQKFGKVIVYTEREKGRHVWDFKASVPKFDTPDQRIDTMKFANKLTFAAPKKVTLQFRTADEESDYFCFGVDLSKVKSLKINDNRAISCPNEDGISIMVLEAESMEEFGSCYFEFVNNTNYAIYAIWPFLPSNMQLSNLLDNNPDKRLAPNEKRIIEVLDYDMLSKKWRDAKRINLKFAAINEKGELIFFDINNVDIEAETVVISPDLFKLFDKKAAEQSQDPNRVEDAESSDFKFIFNEKKTTAAVSGYNKEKSPSFISIPAKVQKEGKVYDVVEISSNAFTGMNSIKKVKMPKTLLNINNFAFYRCENLTDLQIGEAVNHIGYDAFGECTQLKKIEFPNTKLKLDDAAFARCKGVTELYIPANMDTINTRAFSGFIGLEKLNIDKNNNHFVQIDGIVYSKDQKQVIYCMSNRTKDVQILDGVEEIAYGAFGGCEQLRKITIPTSVKRIAPYAFSSCVSVDTFIVPEGVKEIEEGVFSRCLNTRCIELPSTITKIGAGAFLKCEEVDTFILPKGVVEIGEEAFRKCFSVDEIVLPESLKKIGRRAFSMNSIRRISIPDGVTNLPEALFQFARTLEYVKLPNSITVIPRETFDDCRSLKSVTIPESVKIIDHAFSECNSIKTLYIPASVDSIHDVAFHSCQNLEAIIVDKDNKRYCSEDGLLFSKDKTALLFYPLTKSATSYKIPKSVKRLSYNLFSDNKHLTEVIIPNSVVDFGRGHTFSRCENLKKIVLPAKMKKIPDHFFFGCKQLSDVKIPSKIEVIGSSAFYDCPINVKNLILPETLKTIGTTAFCGNPQLESVVIPQGIEYVGYGAFDKCDNLKTIKTPKNAKVTYKATPSDCDIIEY